MHHSEELHVHVFGYKKMACFLIKFYIILPIAARTDFKTDALARPYERSRVTANEMENCQLLYHKSKSCEKIRISSIHCARGHVRTGNFETLKMTLVSY